jgi:chemosensory pili system protein ChpA (sensor histidine kinase/response regulator)
MAGTQDFTALDWVKGEIEETLKQAQQALEGHVDNPEDQTRLRFCLTYLHQVHGTLQMVEFYGAALLAEEMEKVTQALINGAVPRKEDAYETLMRAMLQMPVYLDRIKASRRDMPVVLMPLLNDLRAARGERFISESSLFKPDMTAVDQGKDHALADAVIADPNLVALLRKIRQMYQLALLGVIRGEKLPENLGHMAKVTAKLHRISGDAAIAPLWQVVGAIVEGVASASIDTSTAVKLLLGQVDRQIRGLVDQGAAAFAVQPPQDLIKNLLFYVARSAADTPQIKAVRQLFRLDEALPSEEMVDAERARMAGPDRQTMATVGKAISEELTRVKEALDLFMRGGAQSKVDDLKPHVGTLKQVADTIAVLGMGPQRKTVLEQHDALEGIIKAGRLEDPAVLMDIAGALLYVEAMVSAQGEPARGREIPSSPEQALTMEELGQARDVVVRECRAALELVKERIVEFIASQWDRTHIADVPESLTTARGGLHIIGMERAGAVLRAATDYVNEQLIGSEGTPDWRRMDTLADAISSVEYYLERALDNPDAGDHILEIAEKSVAELGHAVPGAPAPVAQVAAPAAPAVAVAREEPPAAVADKDIAEAVREAEQEDVAVDAATAAPAIEGELSEELAQEPSLDVPMTAAQEHLDVSFVEEEAPLVDEATLELVDLVEPEAEEIVAEAIPEELPAAADVPAAGATGAGVEVAPIKAAADEDEGEGDIEEAAVDEEIVEIFVEEIAEVMEKLDEYFPQWVANQQDETALKEFRRAFHTLKGSGRMVGATYVGELAWSIENMLNRVIDKTILPTPVMIELIRTVKGIVPELVEAFAGRRKPPYDVEPLMAAATSIAGGGRIEAVPPLQPRGARKAAVVAATAPTPAVEPASPAEEQAEEIAGYGFDGAEVPEIAPVAMELDEMAALPVADVDEEEIVLSDVLAGEQEALPVAEAEDLDLESLPADELEAIQAAAEVAIDPALMEIFASESEQHLATVDGWLQGLDPDLPEHPLDDELLRALHTLKGSARMAGIMPVADIAAPLEKHCKEMRNNGRLADAALTAALHDAVRLIRYRIAHLDRPYDPIPGSDALLERIAEIVDASQQAPAAADEDAGSDAGRAVQPRPGLVNELLAQGLDAVLDGSDTVQAWRGQGIDSGALAVLCDELARLADSCDAAGIKPMARVARRLRRVWEAVHEERVTLAQAQDALVTGHEAIVAMFDCMAAMQSVHPAQDAEARLDALLSGALPQAAPAGRRVPGVDPNDPYASLAFSEDEVTAAEVEVVLWSGTTEPTEPTEDVAAAVELLDESPAPEDVAPATRSADAEADAFGELELDEEDFAAAEAEVLAAHGTLEPIEDVGYEAGVPAPEPAEAAGSVTAEVPPAIVPEPVAPPPVAEAPVEAIAVPEPVAPEEDDGEPDHIPERDPELVEIFLEEADEIVESAQASLDAWLSNVDDLIEVQKLQRDLHTLKGGARMAEVAELGDLAHELENLYEGLSQGRLTAQPKLYDLLHQCHDRIAVMVEDVRKKGWCKKGTDLIRAIQAYIESPDSFDGVVSAVSITATPVAPVVPPAAAAVPQAPAPAVALAAEEEAASIDADILEIFLEEAEDLSAQLDAAINGWRAEPAGTQHTDELKRVLHTLKGGARLAGLKRLGDLSHHLETRIIELGSRAPDAAFFGEVNQYHDEIVAQVERVRAGGAAAAAAANAEPMPGEAPAAEVAASAAPVAPVAAVPAAPTPAPAQPARDDDQRMAPAARQAQQQESVKVPADLLEKLVNLAGETSINRSRLEQQTNDFRFSLHEMGATISRLAEQLRRLNAEADEQVKASWEAGKSEGKYSGEFDPLEMDQYSQLHQLTKQLFESASDLLDIRDTLVNRTRDTETLLLQQSRVNTELQEGLMRSRMVPFSRLIPRLRRIVRQVAGELKKQIEIDFINPEGEMDRSLLERIVAPLEHMLRNACDHGVEAPDVRVAAGKPALGRIRVALSREGGEVVLRVADDGKGIPVAAIRKKAMERGLMDENSNLTDQEIIQFILEAGFSTAEKVTQISGRGVGMDVVSSEIKQMGGTLVIRSDYGHGTTFEIRLPFTVSVNRALMVRVGEDQFAVPLQQIEGIVRVSPYELETFYQPGAPTFDYAGTPYRLQYLGGFVHGTAAPDLRGATMPLPVLLVRGGDQPVAIQVDQLIGSREVVVKSVGAQLSTVAGISGATILGDGRVVIILDLMSLIRASHLQHEMALAQERRAAIQAQTPVGTSRAKVRETPLIMVTDDSVTVRKVTSRFLERQGFEVITAKDGMDAVAQLSEVVPDLMLLDIEMPRMDGYEVASHCRHDPRLIELPIIMITSRTGEKHRERAMEIGVNAYLGKPFQENELLAKINELLAERRAQAAQ